MAGASGDVLVGERSGGRSVAAYTVTGGRSAAAGSRGAEGWAAEAESTGSR